MAITVKRLTLNLSKREAKLLLSLCEQMGETQQNIFKRALEYYYQNFKEEE